MFVVLIRAWSLKRFETSIASAPGAPKPVTGIGRTAYAATLDAGPAILAWERGVALTVYGPSPVTAEQLQFLAKVAIGQLDAPS